MQDEAGEWHDLDLALEAADGRLAPRYGAADLTLSAGSVAGPQAVLVELEQPPAARVATRAWSKATCMQVPTAPATTSR